MQTDNQRMYKEYMEQMKVAVERKTGKRVLVQKVSKNNGLVLDGLTILSEEVDVSPTIYLNGFFEEYLDNGLSTVVEKVIAIYETNKPKKAVDISFFTELEKVRPNIKMKLVNYEKNNALLEKVPHIRILDLAIMFIVVVESDCKGFASILIHNHHLEFWKLNTEDLYHIAMSNTANDFNIILMSAIIRAVMDEELADGIMDSADCEMSVLTNQYKMYGAVGMLHKEILNQYMKAKQAEKIVILPSSIHEVLLIPCNVLPDMEFLKSMVREANATQIQSEEVLSNNVYVYNGDTITIAE